MIVVVWSIALVVSLAPQIPQFKDPDYISRIQEKQQCLVSQNVNYQIFATSSTFYVPLLMIFILYWKIFKTARKRIRRRREMKGQILEKVEKTNNNSRVPKSFLLNRKFLRMKKTPSKKSSAAEALVNSLVMMEGQSTTTMEIVEEENETSQTGQEPQVETTAFTISKPQTPALQNSSELPVISNNVSPEKSSTGTTNNGSASHQSHIRYVTWFEGDFLYKMRIFTVTLVGSRCSTRRYRLVPRLWTNCCRPAARKRKASRRNVNVRRPRLWPSSLAPSWCAGYLSLSSHWSCHCAAILAP